MLSSVKGSDLSFSGIKYIKWGQDPQLISRTLNPEKLRPHLDPEPAKELAEVVQSSKLLQSLGKVTDVYINVPHTVPEGSQVAGTVSAAFKMPGDVYESRADRLNISSKASNPFKLYDNLKQIAKQLPETINDLRESISAVPALEQKTTKTTSGSWTIVRGG